MRASPIPLQRCEKPSHPILPASYFCCRLTWVQHPPPGHCSSLTLLSLTLSSLCVSGRAFTFRLTEEGTKYIYIKSTTVSVPSSELGLSHSLSRQRVCPSPLNQTGGHTRLRLRGWGIPNSDDWRKTLALCLLCGRGGRCTKIRRQPKKSGVLLFTHFTLLNRILLSPL